MSYNISTWKTKKLADFRLPVKSIAVSAERQARGWKINGYVIGLIPLVMRFQLDESPGITGHLIDNNSIIVVDKIELGGEGSGSVYNEVLLPALKQSSGEMEAVIVWEGGDSIRRLHVVNGIPTDSPVEL